MADDEQFSLCWNNFNTNLSAGFHESLCRGDLVDVTLAAEGQFIKAHRLVLSVCSPYFRKMFTQMPTNQHAFVFLKDVSHSALKDLIQFMYCGEVNVKQDALPAFISTAEALQIKGLTDGDPAPSQSPAKPPTPAPQQIPAQQTITTSMPRAKTRTRAQPQTQYKIETDDSDVEKATQIVIQTSTAPVTVATSQPQTIQVQVHTTQPQQQQQQTQTQQQQTQQHQTQTVQIQPQTVTTQKRVAQKSITPHTVKRSKLVQQADPLEASEPTQITVQTVTESKTNNEQEFIDLPIELPTKSEPEYAEDAGDVETVEQEATYVEDDSYGDMKYDESYFTENDETGANASAQSTVQATTSTIKQQQPSFSESYVSDAGDQSATEAQETKSQQIKSYGNVRRKLMETDLQKNKLTNLTSIGSREVEFKLKSDLSKKISPKKQDSNLNIVKKIDSKNESKLRDLQQPKTYLNLQTTSIKQKTIESTPPDNTQQTELKSSIPSKVIVKSSSGAEQSISSFYKKTSQEQINIVKKENYSTSSSFEKLSDTEVTPKKSSVKVIQSPRTSPSKSIAPQQIIKLSSTHETGTKDSGQARVSKQIVNNDLIPLHSGSKLLISKTAISSIFTPNVKNYTARLINHLLKADGLKICEVENIHSIITHVTQVFNRRGNPVTESDVEKYVMAKLQKSLASVKK